MTWSLFVIQALNGFQYGVLLFLLAAGLTLVFGIMNFVNLAHGSFYMLGAYLGAAVYTASGSFLLAGVAAVAGTLVIGIAIERTTLTAFYARDHLYQVLATVGLILFFNEVARIIWGTSAVYMRAPQGFGGANLRMVSVLGVNIKLLNTMLFGLGAALAGLAGLMAAPILAVQPGMGDNVIITVLVVIVVGGIGSIRGAFFGALIVGLVDTIGRVYLPILLSQVMERDVADAAGSALASMLIYLFMALVLAVRPQGLFPAVR